MTLKTTQPLQFETGVQETDEAKLASILDYHVRFENDFLERLSVQIEVAERAGIQTDWTEACRSRVSFA
jgi:hypothetical protein